MYPVKMKRIFPLFYSFLIHSFIMFLDLFFVYLQLYQVYSYALRFDHYNRSCQRFDHRGFYRGPCKENSKINYSYSIPQTKKIVSIKSSYEEPNFSNRFFNRQKKNTLTSLQCITSDGFPGFCCSPARCFFQFDDIEDLLANRCKISLYVCCPIDQIRPANYPDIPIVIPKLVRYEAEIPYIEEAIIVQAAREAKVIVNKNLQLELNLVKNRMFQKPLSSESLHQSFFGGPDPVNRKLASDGLIGLETTIILAKKFQLTKEQARDGLQKISLFTTPASNHCPIEPICKESRYRTIDGSCNNLERPLWGKSLTAFIRLHPPDYADGLNTLRKAKDQSDLPLPRVVSTTLATDVDIPELKFTLAVMQWGQFIDHDLTLSASTRIDSEKGEGILCCQDNERIDPLIKHPACQPIIVPTDDPFYSKFDRHCLNFVRNAPSPRPGCFLGPREQTNQLTHYLDASMVYGSTDERAEHLRSFERGKLRNSVINNVEYLPFDTKNKSDECAIPESRNLKCFVGGDVRVNEQTGLTVLHMLLLREHNRIAEQLEYLNQHWDDETIYQETRRIIAAKVQVITYKEWLPLIIGRKTMEKFQLFLRPSGYSYDYNPNLNPGILNEFATAAYRFHTLIQGIFKLMNNKGKIVNQLVLRNLFNNPESLYKRGAFDEYLNCLTAQPTQSFDQFFSQELTNHLFQEHERDFGMDLISLNIQRGRDHGLPGYNTYRKICGLPPIKSFRKLKTVMRKGSAEKMAQIYKSVDDIDLFIAGNHEIPLPGSVVGPTFACILAEQKRRSKLGDRFWFENGKMPHSFSLAQLNELRKTSLAAIICDNADSILKMQPLAFVQPSEWNPKIDCNKIERLNLDYWKDKWS